MSLGGLLNIEWIREAVSSLHPSLGESWTEHRTITGGHRRVTMHGAR